MVAGAARVDSRLMAALARLDRGDVSIAETYRRLGDVAREHGLVRSSYERVRTLVHEARRRGRQPSAGDVLLDVAFRSRPTEAVLDYLAGTLVDARGRRVPPPPSDKLLLGRCEPVVKRLGPETGAFVGG